MNKQTLKNIGLFIGCVILCQAAGGIGTIATIPNIPTWYASLNKPSFQPPNWLFGPVWTILYTLMAVVLYILIRSDHPIKRKAITVFTAQLILNAYSSSIISSRSHWQRYYCCLPRSYILPLS
jgi:tryptophan-rich sensory protein